MDLNAEEVEEEQDNMWRTMHKLSKGFGDLPNPKRSAESIKMRLQKFKENLPLIHIFCNPGIRDRHWQIVREFDSIKHCSRDLLWFLIRAVDCMGIRASFYFRGYCLTCMHACMYT